MDKNIPKNLIYFIWWKPENGMLKFNLNLLEQYIHLFDHKIIRIADGNGPLPDFLKDAQIVKNHRGLGEAPHFKESLKEIKEGVTFYGHAKGVARPVNNPLKWWVTQLYKGNLDSPPNLKGYLTSGCFGKFGAYPLNVTVPWHYSGSFFWFTQEILERYKKSIAPASIDNRWFTENFCGWLAKKEEAEFRLHSNDRSEHKCYSERFWERNKHLIP